MLNLNLTNHLPSVGLTCFQIQKRNLLSDFNKGSFGIEALHVHRYREHGLNCPYCHMSARVEDVFMRGETGGQMHTCLNCCQVFLAAHSKPSSKLSPRNLSGFAFALSIVLISSLYLNPFTL